MHVCMHVSMYVVIDSTRVEVVQLFKPLNTRISARIKYVLSNYSNSKLDGLKLSSLGPHPNPFSILSGNKASEYFVCFFFLVQPDLYLKYDHSMNLYNDLMMHIVLTLYPCLSPIWTHCVKHSTAWLRYRFEVEYSV